MILGLSHLAFTCSNLEKSIEFYKRTFGLSILSDAERKGPKIEQITGIPGFHTRTVYLAIRPDRHLELFQFYYPKSTPASNQNMKAGIKHCVFIEKNMDQIELPDKSAVKDDSVVSLTDPDTLSIKIIQQSEDREPFYPLILVKNINESMEFFINTLGLELAEQDELPNDRYRSLDIQDQYAVKRSLLKGAEGICLELNQPIGVEVSPVGPFQMEKIGFTHIAFGVKNIEAMYDNLRTRGVEINSPPIEVTAGPHVNGKTIYFKSPDGLTLELLDSPITQKTM